jgi:hypothetical protein
MRQIAHNAGATIKPVIVVDKRDGQGQGCYAQQAQPKTSICDQVQRVLIKAKANARSRQNGTTEVSVTQEPRRTCVLNASVCKPHGQGDTSAASGSACKQPSKLSKEVKPHASVPHLLALPAECNLTGVRPSASALHALCSGTAVLPEVCFMTCCFCSKLCCDRSSGWSPTPHDQLSSSSSTLNDCLPGRNSTV